MENLIHKKITNLTDSVYNLVNLLHDTENVDTDSKQIILSNKIDLTDHLESKEVYVPNLGLRKIYDPKKETYSVYNGTAKITCFNSGEVKYEDLESKTTLLLKDICLGLAIVQEKKSTRVQLDSDQTKKILATLSVSENLDSMLSIVDTARSKLTSLSEKQNKDSSPEIISNIKSADEIAEIINKTRQQNSSYQLLKKKLKIIFHN